MTDITVDPLAGNPTLAWQKLSEFQKTIKINVKLPKKSVDNDKVRFVCISDTHSLIKNLPYEIPEGDVLIHAGDFTKCGEKEEVLQFNKWLGELPHKYKLVIAGNHELSFDQKFTEHFKKKANLKQNENDVLHYGSAEENIIKAVNVENIRQYLTNCIYLEDSEVNIYGIKVYGTPWQPEFGGWAFNLPRGVECLSKWKQIPENVDILVTHTPPLGHGDLACSGVRAGCVDLLNIVQQRVKPKYHVFGHIHEGYGVSSDGKIIFINASICDINYIPQNLPVVFDIPIPLGYSKT